MPTKTAPLFAVYGLAASLGPKSHLFTTHKTHYAPELELRLSLSLAPSLSLSLSRDALAPTVIIEAGMTPRIQQYSSLEVTKVVEP